LSSQGLPGLLGSASGVVALARQRGEAVNIKAACVWGGHPWNRFRSARGHELGEFLGRPELVADLRQAKSIDKRLPIVLDDGQCSPCQVRCRHISQGPLTSLVSLHHDAP